MSIESGVKNYVRAHAVIDVNFPVDFKDREYVCCAFCYYYAEPRCRLNGEIPAFPHKYVGQKCPLEIEPRTSGYVEDDDF